MPEAAGCKDILPERIDHSGPQHDRLTCSSLRLSGVPVLRYTHTRCKSGPRLLPKTESSSIFQIRP